MTGPARVARGADTTRRSESTSTAADHEFVWSWGDVFGKLIEGNPGILMPVVLSDILHGFKVSQAKCCKARVFRVGGREEPRPLVSPFILRAGDLPEYLMRPVYYLFEFLVLSSK